MYVKNIFTQITPYLYYFKWLLVIYITTPNSLLQTPVGFPNFFDSLPVFLAPDILSYSLFSKDGPKFSYICTSVHTTFSLWIYHNW